MKKETTPITVLQSFDGFNVQIVDTVDRIIQYGGYRTRKGNPQVRRRSVSYKGSNYSVFSLSPQTYDVVHHNCISLD